MSKAAQQVQLKELAPKSIFYYGGVNWLVLQNTGGGVLCLSEKNLFNKAFDEEDRNYWSDSTLREYLNNDFLEECILNGANEAAFLPMVLDLTADDGLDDYGTCEDLIGLISCQQYRQYRKIIPNADGWWWTITPYSTKANGYSRNVRYVDSDGALSNDNACSGDSGVRPLCTLQSSILVSVIHKEEGNQQEEPESKELEETEENTTEAPTQTPELIAKANKQFCECILKAEERFLKGNGDLQQIINAIQVLNCYKGGLPL